MKVVINDVKTGKSYQKEFDNDLFIGRKIKEKIEGNVLGLADYEFEITGGSDSAGFPHRSDVEGSGRRKILASKGVGVQKKVRKGIKIRRTVMGNTISANTAQVSLKVVKYGKEALDKVLGGEKKEGEEKPKEEAPKVEEKPKEIPKEEPKKEEKPEVKEEPVEKPKEEVKPEVKEEKKE